MNALLQRQAQGVQFVCRKQQKAASRSSLRVSASTDVWLPGALEQCWICPVVDRAFRISDVPSCYRRRQATAPEGLKREA